MWSFQNSKSALQKFEAGQRLRFRCSGSADAWLCWRWSHGLDQRSCNGGSYQVSLVSCGIFMPHLFNNYFTNRSTESTITSSYQRSARGIIVIFKYESLGKNISNSIFYDWSFQPFWRKIYRDKIVSFIFGQTIGYRIYIPWVESQSDHQKSNIQFLVVNNYIYLRYTQQSVAAD